MQLIYQHFGNVRVPIRVRTYLWDGEGRTRNEFSRKRSERVSIG